MDDALDRLADRALRGDGPLTRRFRALGAPDFAAAARHVWRLPYGRITERMRFGLVLDEGRGTCTTKHALLAELAREQAIEVQLTLAIYEMSERNTPGVGTVLARHGLECIPEAHCFLRHEGARIDVTGVPAGAEPIERLLHEEPITIAQIGDYKIARHRQFLADWLARRPEGGRLDLEEAWRIREACIAALGARTDVRPG
jgi:hypothetical protein